METIYLGMWDNYPKGSEERECELQEVLDAVDKFGEVRVSFGYSGFTAEEIAGVAMLEEAKKRGYTGTVGYRQKLILRKK